MLASVSAAVEGECGVLLKAVLAPHSGLHGFNLLANSVLAEVDDALLRCMPGDPPSLAAASVMFIESMMQSIGYPPSLLLPSLF